MENASVVGCGFRYQLSIKIFGIASFMIEIPFSIDFFVFRAVV